MFTGLITDVGRIERIDELPQGRRFRVLTAYDPATLDIGASIALGGVCLSVVAREENWLEVEAWEEALRLTTLGDMIYGDRINLERALKHGDELGGHLVSGHVDGIATIVKRTPEGCAVRFLVQAPQALSKFIAAKGSVTLDGTSLTVNAVEGNRFDVLLIKHSLEVTTWGERMADDRVNLEIDQMARYAARLLETK